MPLLKEHMQDSINKFGEPFEKVHRYMDSYSSKFGHDHRFMLHHKEGIEEVREKWGDKAGEAAKFHVLLDCGHIPNKVDYQTGKVDSGGFVSVVNLPKGYKQVWNGHQWIVCAK